MRAPTTTTAGRAPGLLPRGPQTPHFGGHARWLNCPGDIGLAGGPALADMTVGGWQLGIAGVRGPSNSSGEKPREGDAEAARHRAKPVDRRHHARHAG